MRERVSRVVKELLELVAGAKTDLAESAEVSYASLHAWSAGRRAPTLENARKLARVAQARAARIAELAGLLSRYARTGELTAESMLLDGDRLRERPRLDREQLQEIQERARLLQETATETMAWIHREENGNGSRADPADAERRAE